MSEKDISDVVELVEFLDDDCQSVSIFSNDYVGNRGIGREIQAQLKQLTEQGIDVQLFVFRTDLRAPDGVNITTFWEPSSFYLRKLYRLLFPLNIIALLFILFRAKDTDVAIGHRYPMSAVGPILKGAFGIPYAIWNYDVPMPTSDEPLPYQISLLVLKYLEENSFIIRNADLICSISESSQQLLKENYDLDSVVIHNSAELTRFEDTEANEKGLFHEYQLSEDDKLIIYVGRLIPDKNVHRLVESFERVKEKVDDSVKLAIVGSMSDPKYADRIVSDASDDVILTGYIDDEMLLAFYMNADVFATCSLQEGRNLPPVEAQQFGTSVVAFNVPGIRDTFQQGQLVTPENYDEYVDALAAELYSEG